MSNEHTNEPANDAPVGNNKYLRFLLTRNNPGTWRPVFNERTMAYMAWGNETAPTTGTAHIHIYIRYKNRRYWTTVQREFEGTDIRMARGNEQQCRDYCHKDAGDHGDAGTFDPDAGKQGRRTDLDAVVARIRSGATVRDIAENHPTEFLKFHAGIARMITVLAPLPPPVRNVTVTILWGETGVGKTHRILTTHPGTCLIRDGRDPFQSYDRHDIICFDEFNYERWTIQQMNAYCDKWPVELDCRYANKHAFWTRVFLTANTSPFQWWPLEPQPLRESFWRRITNNITIYSRDDVINI